MLYRQKSAAVTLAAILLIYGAYGAITLYGPPRSESAMIWSLIGVTILFVNAVAIGHIVLAIQHRRAEVVDERDRAIDREASARAYHVMSLGAFGILALGLLGTPPILIANAALFFFAAAEVVRLGSQLRLYARRS